MRLKSGMTTRAMPEQDATPAANDTLLANMREMMEEMHRDIISRFEAIVADVVKREVTDALAPLETKLGSYASAISDLEGAANDHEQRLTSIQASVSQLQEDAQSSH
ncbi:unnamed protein product [Knipowitschia caucasica]